MSRPIVVSRGEAYMSLTRTERERITDSRLKIQAVAHSLSHVDPEKIPDIEMVQECLEGTEKSLSGALRSDRDKTES